MQASCPDALHPLKSTYLPTLLTNSTYSLDHSSSLSRLTYFTHLLYLLTYFTYLLYLPSSSLSRPSRSSSARIFKTWGSSRSTSSRICKNRPRRVPQCGSYYQQCPTRAPLVRGCCVRRRVGPPEARAALRWPPPSSAALLRSYSDHAC